MKYWVVFLYLLGILNAQCFGVGETKATNDNISEEIYKRFETQLERMKLQAAINHDTQLWQQKELFGNLERKLNDLTSKFDGIQEKLFEAIKINTEHLKDFVKAECRPQVVAVTPAVDDKMLIMIDIKEKLVQQGQILNQIRSNQNDTRQLIKETVVTNHTQTLKTTIDDNLIPLRKMDEKLKAIEENSIPKIDQLKFYQDIQQHLNATEKYLKNGNHSHTSINQSYPTSCAEYNANYCKDNKCHIVNELYGSKPFLVSCNNSVDGGGWTVIQRRINGSVDFYRDWSEYKSGFGNLEGEFFIGLEKLHALISSLKPVELLIELQDFDDVLRYAKYDDFEVASEDENYKILQLGSYVGDAGESLRYHVGYGFTTRDRDNDEDYNINCAETLKAAWWYSNCYRSVFSNLNGQYHQHPTKFYDSSLENLGITWYRFHGDDHSLKSVQMMIRPRN